MKSVFIFMFCLLCTSGIDAARILGVFPMPAPSHYFLGSALMKGLAEAGHDVTMISPFPVKDPPKNGSWRDIILDGMMEDMEEKFKKIDLFTMQQQSAFSTILFLNFMGQSTTEKTLSHPKVQELIHSNEKFDVVIVSQFVTDGLKPLANHFQGHLVLFSNTAVNSWLNHLVGNPTLPSFHPEVLLGLPKRMNFFERLSNTLFYVLQRLNLELWAYPKQNALSKKYIPNAVDLDLVNRNVSLLLLNSHTSLFNPQPLLPCMVEIGGFHISPSKKLPQDLQKYLDEAKQGVIYFSMGSNLKSNRLPVEKRDALLKAFGKRKEKVLWKWEDDTLPGQPPNVKLGKWLPQQEILAHPNVKVFITHGGLLSTTETVYHGVPIVAIPVLGDQQMNARGAEQAGYGIVLPFPELTEEKLTSYLDEIISNPKYRKNVQARSRIMKDREVTPLQTAVYWVEYVIRHNGAEHLRVAYLDLAWYQFYLLDVITFIAVVLFIALILLKKTISYVCRRKSDKTNTKTDKTKKTN
uniref:UDP-glucuronosyltransferase n=1 Tax=Xylotrechus quadripes TaxID=554073 RepID=A0A6G7SFA7_9CUCU|nr:UDP-glycosyltransferase [Xylotrechus quadripes]